MRDITEYLKKIGGNGGRKAAANMTAAERSARAKKAADAAAHGSQNLNDFIRTTIRARPTGVTPAEIRNIATAAKLEYNPDWWPYVALHRLKAAGEILKRGDKYYTANPITHHHTKREK